MSKVIDYFLDDLSGVSSNQLKLALRGYELGLISKNNQKNEDAILRIEGELLHRKDVTLTENNIWRSEYA